jgi:RNA-directed DNA polymerase
VGRVIELRKSSNGVVDAVLLAEDTTDASVKQDLEAYALPESKSSAREHMPTAREPGDLTGTLASWDEGSSRKGKGRNPRTHAGQKSDALVVAKKPANSEVTPEESVERRGAANGEPASRNAPRAQDRIGAPTSLERVGHKAARDKEERFVNLMCHLKVPLLRKAFEALRQDAAAGVDGQTWTTYAERLETNLIDLQDRIHRGSYHPLPVRRVFIAKADGSLRPLGIPAVEDKLVQQAVRMLIEPIFERQFMGFSYGFRPGRGTHRALDALAVSITKRKTNWILDGDIKSFFDSIDHEKLKMFLEHRIGDRRLVRLLMKWLHAGVMQEGNLRVVETGTPQGGVISPLLANIYLHYVLDLWVHQWRKRHARREVYVVRYADDFVMGFEDEKDARTMMAGLRERLARFGLELHPTKTRLLRFGRYAKERAAARGEPNVLSFDFLGFTHIVSADRRGDFRLLRHTSRKRRGAKLKLLRQELRLRRHEPMAVTHAWLTDVLRGHYAYFGVPTNERALGRFRFHLQHAWHRQLQRRSQRAKWTVGKTCRFERRFKLPLPEIRHPWPEKRFVAR